MCHPVNGVNAYKCMRIHIKRPFNGRPYSKYEGQYKKDMDGNSEKEKERLSAKEIIIDMDENICAE